MKLARALKVMARDRNISCLGVVRDGTTGYVDLLHVNGGMQIRSGGTLKLSIPFRRDTLSKEENEIIALMASETEWTAFREGLPLEDDEAIARPKKARAKR